MIRRAVIIWLVLAGVAFGQVPTPKLLSQSNPAATTLTDIYTTPSTKYVLVTTIWIANRDVLPHTFRMSIAPAGAADTLAQYIYYGVPIPPNASLVQSVNLPLSPSDVIRAYDDAQQLSFSIYGVSP